MNQVYVKTDAQERVIDISSDAYLTDTTGWTQVDEGDGDRYRNAQGNYQDGPMRDEAGRPRYKLADGAVVERTAEELAGDAVPEACPTEAERLDALEAAMLELAMGGDA